VSDQAEVTVLSLPEGEVLGKVSISPTCSGKFEFSPDGALLAAPFGDFIHVCDASDGSAVLTFDAPTAEVMDLSFSPNGLFLASSGYTAKAYDEAALGFDSAAQIWSIEEQTHIRSLSAHHGNVMSLAFSPDGEILATGTGTKAENTCFDPAKDNAIRFWRVEDWKLLSTISAAPNGVSDMAYSPNGDIVLVGGLPERYRMCGPFPEQSASLWLVQAGPPVFAAERELDPLWSAPAQVEFWPEANVFAAIWDWGAVFKSPQGEPLPSPGCPPPRCQGVAMGLAKSGDLVALSIDGQSIGLWGRTDTALKRALPVDELYTWLAFSPEGTLLLGASRDLPGVITLWGIPPRP